MVEEEGERIADEQTMECKSVDTLALEESKKKKKKKPSHKQERREKHIHRKF